MEEKLHDQLLLASITKTDVTIGPEQAGALFQLVEALEIVVREGGNNDWLKSKLAAYHKLPKK